MKKLNLIGAIVICALSSQAQSTNGLVAHWNFNGNANDNYGTHHGTLNNVTLATGKAGVPNTAYYFNGSMSFISVPYQNDLNIDSFTISAVVKTTKFNTDVCQGNFIFSRGTHSDPGHYGMSFSDLGYNDCNTADTTKYNFYATIDNPPIASNAALYQYSPNVATNTWYCVSITYTPDIMNIYIDGMYRASNYPTGPMGSSNDGITIGRHHQFNQAWQYPFTGFIDDIKIYKRVLADTEIINYCNSFTNETPGDTTGNDTSLYVQQFHQPNINLYPNPNNGNIIIAGTIASNEAGNLSITNAVGQIVYSETIVPVNYIIEKKINLSGKLPSGIYIVQYKTRYYSWTRRMTVKE